MAAGWRPGAPDRQVSIAPLPLLSGILLLGLAVVAVTLALALRGPWLGADFVASSEPGVIVTHVVEDGPAAGILRVGDRVQALRPEGGRARALNDFAPELEPHTRPTFEAYNAYLATQGRVLEMLDSERVYLRTQRDTVYIEPATSRPLSTLPSTFWLFHAFGLLALLISSAVWVFRRHEKPAAFLALSGAGFFLATAAHSVWVVRELALPAPLFDTLLRVNHFGLTLLTGGLICLLAYYPTRLPRLRLLRWSLLALVAYQLNENLQLFNLPWHTFYLPMLVTYAIAAALAFFQWQMARHDPVNRGVLKWISLSVFLSMGGGIALYFLPTLMGQSPYFSQIYISGIGVTLYIGFALGVLRYRLFDLDYWWLLAWVWFLGGVVVVGLDLALVVFLGWGPLEASGVAVLLVAWGYLPLRHWIWTKLTGHSGRAIEDRLPGLAESIVQSRGASSADDRWKETIQSLFSPLTIKRMARPAGEPEIKGYGAEMIVPGIGGSHAYCLYHADGGARLFSSRDVVNVSSLLKVAQRLFRVREAEAEGARHERARIIRDLHDDVGGRVLALIHSAGTERQAELARKALDALRDTIGALDDNESATLEEVLADWHEEAAMRADAAGVELIWENDCDVRGDAPLTPRQRINLHRVLDEALTNGLRHATPTRVRVRLEISGACLNGRVSNNGLPEELTHRDKLRPGRGLHNMRTRMGELEGELTVGIAGEVPDHELEIRFTMPLEDQE